MLSTANLAQVLISTSFRAASSQATALTTPVLCQADTYDSLASDAVCDLWLNAGHSCSTKWEDICDNDNPNGADQNSYTVASISCTQCPVDLCSPTTYFEGISENLICDLWFDAGHSCSTKWEDVCTVAHPRGAQFNSNTLSTVNCFQCPTCGTGWGNYVLADSGAHDCMGCGEPITSYNDCVIAALSGAAALGIGPLQKKKNWDGPPGCHIQEGSNFQFNSNMDGTSAESHTPVCLISSSPLPPSPPPSPPAPPAPPPTPPTPPASPPGTFTSKASLKAAVLAFTENADAAIATYGPFADWDVSGVSDMSELFRNLQNFDADLSSWNTSSVTNMYNMFHVRSAHGRMP